MALEVGERTYLPPVLVLHVYKYKVEIVSFRKVSLLKDNTLCGLTGHHINYGNDSFTNHVGDGKGTTVLIS